MKYFKDIVAKFVEQSDVGGTYEINAFARLMLKTMTTSYNTLATMVPFELTSRYLTGYIEKNQLSCLSFAAVAS